MLGGVELGGNTVGLLYLLGASAMWAAYIVVGSPRWRSIGRGVAGLGIGLAIGAVALDPVRRAAAAGRCGRRPDCSLACLLVGVFSNAIGYGIDQHVLRRIPVRRFSVLLALLPVTAVVIGWIALDQRPSSASSSSASRSCSPGCSPGPRRGAPPSSRRDQRSRLGLTGRAAGAFEAVCVECLDILV